MKLGRDWYVGYSRAKGSLPPLPSGARSSKGTPWNCVGRPVPGIIVCLFITGRETECLGKVFVRCYTLVVDAEPTL